MIAELESASRPTGLVLPRQRARRQTTLRPAKRLRRSRRRQRDAGSVTPGTRRAGDIPPVEPAASAAPSTRTARAGSASPSPASGSEDFLLELYMREALREPLLERDEEFALGQRARAGDAAARERLVLANLRLVVRLAHDYRSYGLPVPDLISEGNLGLWRAAELFNPDFGVRFATYAATWIKQRIRRALSNQSRLVRLPLGVVECVSRLRTAEHRFQAEFGRTPTDDELATDTELVSYLIHRLRQVALQSYVSLDAPVSTDDDSPGLSESLADESAATPDESLAQSSDREFVRRLLTTLPPRDQRVLRLRYGFDDGCERSMEEVGRILGVVRQRVQQIEAAALLKLRKRARAEGQETPARAVAAAA